VEPSGTPDLSVTLRSRAYLALLVLAAVLGAPISVAAYGFLQLVNHAQHWIFSDLPRWLGLGGEPVWWPLPWLALAGVLVGLTIRYLPGRGGHSPADGFQPGGAPTPRELPGVVLAALATLCLGVVLGPEAPLVALGGGLAVIAVRVARRGAAQRTTAVVAAAGSFASISALMGSPILGAFLLMEASGLGGAALELVLIPGLLASGIGFLVFVGLDAWTGLGTASLSIPNLPPVGPPTLAQFGWALAIGAAAALVGSAIRSLGLFLRPHVERRIILLTPVAGLAVAGLAIAFALGTGRSTSEVLFSGQLALGPFLVQASTYSVAALALLLACKGLAYGVSLSAFRGGPIFPAMFLGAAGGVALSHLPGLPMIAGAAMGIGAMSAVLLRLPLTSVLVATLLLLSDGLQLMPLVIVAVVVAYVLSYVVWSRLGPAVTRPPAPPTVPGRVDQGGRSQPG
jgi:H+/Cl- antiporter ClcA